MLIQRVPWKAQPQTRPHLAPIAGRKWSFLASSPGLALLGGLPSGGTGLTLRTPRQGGLAVGATGTGGRNWTGVSTGADYTFLAVVDFYASGTANHAILDSDSTTAGLRTFQFRVDSVLDGVQLTVFNTSGSVFSASGATSLYDLGPVVVAGRVRGTELTAWLNGRIDATATLTGTPRSLDATKLLWLANTGRSQTTPNLNDILAAEVFDGAMSDAFLSSIRTPADYYSTLFAPRSIWVPVSAATGGYTLTAEAGAFTLAGQDATLLKSKVLAADAGSFAIAGQDATLVYTPAAGAYILTCDAGAFAIGGQDATFVYTPLNHYTLTAEAGAFQISGQQAQLVYTGQNVQDTHDGFWTREWLKLRDREKKKPTVAEVVEVVKESPQVVEMVRPQVQAKYPDVDYADVVKNVQLQRFIARQLLEMMQEEDDMEALLLL